MGVVAVAGGVLKSGFNPLVSLSGTTVSPGRGLRCSARASPSTCCRCSAVASIALLLSTVTHNSAAAVVGALMFSLLMQLHHDRPGPRRPAALPAADPVQRLAGPAAHARGLCADIRAAWVCALYAIPCLGVAFLAFLRRDVAGG